MPHSNDWRLGLVLAGSTVFLWATLPVAAKLALGQIDAYTLTWFRFAFAMGATAVMLKVTGRSPLRRDLPGKVWLVLIAAALGLMGNYLLYLVGLHHTTPANAQIIIQTAPLLMGLGGVVFFGERFNRVQWMGLGVLLSGMGMFFRDQLSAMFAHAGDYLFGSTVIVLAAVAWAAYALLQKKVSSQVGGQGVLLFTYTMGTVLMLPMVDGPALVSLRGEALWAVLYLGLNTVLAYGAFAKAMELWESARVSAVLTLTPLGTLVIVQVLAALGSSWVQPEQITALGWLGALLVVTGSATVSLGGRLARRRTVALEQVADGV